MAANSTAAGTHALAAAISVLRDHGLRISAARRLVLEALLAADGPMSVDQIARGIGGRVPCSDRASVYRNLERLEEIGLVGHVHLGHGARVYELMLLGEREYLSCPRCADFRAVDPSELDPIRAQIEQRFGFRPRFSHYAAEGLCAACLADERAGVGRAARARPRLTLAGAGSSTA